MGNASSWVTKSDHDDNFPLVPSAKTTALKATLLAGFNEAPTDKVVIYTQFRTLARIIGRMCKQEAWGFLYLTGDASLAHRSKVIKMFREDESIMILIAGLKCGGVGYVIFPTVTPGILYLLTSTTVSISPLQTGVYPSISGGIMQSSNKLSAVSSA